MENEQTFGRVFVWSVVLAVVALIAWDLAQQFRENEVVRYYSRRPVALVLIAGIACSVGVAAEVLRRKGYGQVLLAALWGATNALTTTLGGLMLAAAISMFMFSRTETGRLVARNAQSQHVPIFFGAVAAVILFGTFLSWLFLVRYVRAGRS